MAVNNYLQAIVDEIVSGDGSGLCVLGSGLGLPSLAAELIHRHCSPDPPTPGVLLVLGASDGNRRAIEWELAHRPPGGILEGPSPREGGGGRASRRGGSSAGDVAGVNDKSEEEEEEIVVEEEEELEVEKPEDCGAGGAGPAEPAAPHQPPAPLRPVGPPLEVSAEVPVVQRLELYKRDGSALFVTTRILTVDLLRGDCDPSHVAGVVVMGAHRATEDGGEAFAVRLLRQRGGARWGGYVRGLTEDAPSLSAGFNKVERVMRALCVRRVHIWPRFRTEVQDSLSSPPEVEELHQRVTGGVQMIQEAIMDVMTGLLKDLKRSNPQIDVADITPESGLFRSFEFLLRRQLDPIWSTLTRRTRQLVWDLATVGKLAQGLLQYDPVTFLRHLEALRAGEGRRSTWMFYPAANVIFEQAKARVYLMSRDAPPGAAPDAARPPKKAKGESAAAAAASAAAAVGGVEGPVGGTEDGGGVAVGGMGSVEIVPVLEEVPKWSCLREVVAEVQRERSAMHESDMERRRRSEGAGPSGVSGKKDGAGAAPPNDFMPILVVTRDWSTAQQLRGVLGPGGGDAILQGLFESYLLSKLSGGPATAPVPGNAPGPQKTDVGGRGGKGGGRGGRGGGGGRGGRWGRGRRDATAEVLGLGAPGGEGSGLDVDPAGPSVEHAALCRTAKALWVTKKAPEKKGRKKKGDKQATPAPAVAAPAPAPAAVPVYSGLWLPPPPPPAPGTKEAEAPHLLSGVYISALEGSKDLVALRELRPGWVILYDPDVSVVRQLEVYNWRHPGRLIKASLLFYEDSFEAKRYELSVDRESRAFASLIRVRGTMAVPTEAEAGRTALALPPPAPGALSVFQPGVLEGGAAMGGIAGTSTNALTRIAGGRAALQAAAKPQAKRVIVDIREFASSLPSVLHAQGFEVVPVTLEVGDYILGPDVVVERKALADLIQSLPSGRLYHQATSMCRHYRHPVLLIEFDDGKSFALQSQHDIADDIDGSATMSRLSLLLLHFPRLRVVWSRGPHSTADVFRALKAGREEPDAALAAIIGLPEDRIVQEGGAAGPGAGGEGLEAGAGAGAAVGDGPAGAGQIKPAAGRPAAGAAAAAPAARPPVDSHLNRAAVDVLLHLPGIHEGNYRRVMAEVSCVADLASLPRARLEEILGSVRNAKALRDFLDAACPVMALV